MRHAAACQRAPAGETRHRCYVALPHDAGVVDRNVHEHAVEVHVLLRVRVDEVVVMVSGDGQNRLAIELGIVEAIQQVQPPGTGGGQTDAEPAGVLRVGTGHEGGRFLVPNLHEAHALLPPSQRFHHTVDAVTRKAEDDLNAPVFEGVDEDVGRGGRHGVLLDHYRAGTVALRPLRARASGSSPRPAWPARRGCS